MEMNEAHLEERTEDLEVRAGLGGTWTDAH